MSSAKREENTTGSADHRVDCPPQHGGGWRETIESVVIALVLAFLFRTFEAEAFVIPTGSMATTLMGRHKDVICPECGMPFQVNASDEVDKLGRLLPHKDFAGAKAGACPNCNFELPFSGADGQVTSPSYKGDRILVAKQAYAVADPKRWDVLVFRYPHAAATNYIKRLVGLPGETVKIAQGDVLTRVEKNAAFAIARKPPQKVAALLRGVHNNDHLASRLHAQGWPPRWRPWSPTRSRSNRHAWVSDDGHRRFTVDQTAEEMTWLAYQHVIPSAEVWEAVEQDLPWDPWWEKPRLITDMTAYNSSVTMSGPLAEYANSSDRNESKGLHWVGDLAIDCTVEIEEAYQNGSLTLLLVEGGRHFRCVFDLNRAKVRLAGDGMPGNSPTADTVDLSVGVHHLCFANVDDQLLLWIDERLVKFDSTTEYAGSSRCVPTAQDLVPIRIGARAANLAITHLEVRRDLYYIADRQSRLSDYTFLPFSIDSEQEIAAFFSNPERWPPVFDDQLRSVAFELLEDQFFVLGDNSARSQDGRLWRGGEHFFDRELIIGKALMIYWPHAWDTSFSVPLPGTDIRVPFYPNFSRMRRIR